MGSRLIIGNWKMHGTQASCVRLIEGIRQGLDELPEQLELGIAPPFVYLPMAIELCAGTRIQCGAQDASQYQAEGACTGEVCCTMLADLGVGFVIVGHSERRARFAESDPLVAAKFAAARAASLRPVLCVGETLEQRRAEVTDEVVLAQLTAVLDHVGTAAFDQAVIAYEPVWAIGTGETASPQQAQQVHALLRGHLASSDAAVAAAVPILYGGSVKPDNAAALFAQPDIDGGLVGGASLQAAQFLAICASTGQGG